MSKAGPDTAVLKLGCVNLLALAMHGGHQRVRLIPGIHTNCKQNSKLKQPELHLQEHAPTQYAGMLKLGVWKSRVQLCLGLQIPLLCRVVWEKAAFRERLVRVSSI